MIVYFADRKMNILGQASTTLPKGLMVTDDTKNEDVESGVAVFECEFGFDANTRAKIEACVEVGNYILRKHDEENEFYTIIDSEIDTKKQTAYIYAEDAGLDLLNEIVGAYEADQAYPIDHYIEKFAYDSGFVIGVNEAAGLTRKLIWDGEETVTARLASVAKQFDGCEISFSFDIKNLRITAKKINIFKDRGKDIGTTLHLNKEIDNIVVKKTIVNVATALMATGGTPEDTNTEDDIEPVPITLRGYEYDDGDFYIDGDTLKCRSALAKWSRYINPNEQELREGHEGHIVRPYSFDTTSQAELCAHTITELKKLIDAEINYEADILYLPDNTKIGDRVNIVDEAGELFLSARLLQLKSSVVRQEQKATLGEFLIKKSGISEKVIALADQFATEAAANRKAREEAARKAAEAEAEAEAARQAAEEAATKAAQAEADLVAAQQAAAESQRLANEAQAQADAAAQASAQAKADAAAATASAQLAQSSAQTATTKAAEAEALASTATTNANDAKTTAAAAKLDAEQAQKDIASLGENLETVTNTMTADYARKTDLTNTEASLQSQISQNAAQISSTVSRMETIDETANNAKAQAEAAKSGADTAKAAADAATKAANDAESKVTQAEKDLASAQQNLANVTNRVGATESEIAEAQAAVVTAQAAADKAKADAANAQAAASAAQKAADDAQDAVDGLATRVTNAETKIIQNSDQIALRATKTEVTNTLGGYYTKEQTDSAISVKANEITQSVSGTYATKDSLSSAESRITQTEKSIASQVSATDGLTSRTSTLEQRANGFDASIADASKTATSYLSYDSTNGLQIGNKQSGSWSGYRAQVKPDAFNILDASGNPMASYGANKVELGKNNRDAIIGFCNDRMTIGCMVEGNTDYSSIEAEAIRVLGKKRSYIGVKETLNDAQETEKLAQIMFTQNPDVLIRAVESWHGTSVNSESLLNITHDGIVAESSGSIRLVAPTVTVEGDHGITGMYYDNLGQPIRNGLAAYDGSAASAIDPNTTLEELILSNHSNAPEGSGVFYFIRTTFYSGKGTGANRAQVAIPYNKIGPTYKRYFSSGSWSAWQAETTMERIWANSATTSAFAAQTITIPNLNSYDYVWITFSAINASASQAANLLVSKGRNGLSNHITHARYDGGTHVCSRTVTVNFSANTVVFETGKQNGSELTTRMIPQYILGIKGVLDRT